MSCFPNRRGCPAHIPYHNPNTAIPPRPHQGFAVGLPVSETNPYASNIGFLGQSSDELIRLSKHIADPYDSNPLYNHNNPSGLWGAPNTYYNPNL
jgi:hypothetical protein